QIIKACKIKADNMLFMGKDQMVRIGDIDIQWPTEQGHPFHHSLPYFSVDGNTVRMEDVEPVHPPEIQPALWILIGGFSIELIVLQAVPLCIVPKPLFRHDQL